MLTEAEQLANTLMIGDVPKEIKEDEPEQGFPELSIDIQRKGEKSASCLTMKLVSAIWGGGKIYYFEAISTSDMTANALIAALSGEFNTTFYMTRDDAVKKPIAPPLVPSIADARIKIPNWSKHVHHTAALDRSGSLILANRGEVIWKKMREIMTTPTLEDWGKDLIGKIMRSCLLEAKTFGIKDDVRAYVVAPEAQKMFDNIICEYVKANGLERTANVS